MSMRAIRCSLGTSFLRRGSLAHQSAAWLARKSHSSILSLQDAFRDPSSPFHIPPGSQGPASPDPPVDVLDPAEEARETLIALGYDPTSFWEQRIVWGDHDAFQHVNNVRYLRFLESSRMQWIVSLAHELGGESRANNMLTGKGVSLIIKSVSADFKRPVVYPDTLLIGHRPHTGLIAPNSHGNGTEEKEKRLAKTHFYLKGAVYSYAQRRIVTEGDSILVWYDYDKLAKCDPGEDVQRALLRRMALAPNSKP
ncbi:uncharacterized protein FIBRA_04761 [Fibroporia radiculosa]|uniref:Thioesterase domain-containing protein n=1 Tax=Fibroporia radiculosa TaxID=599839 RepID=J4HWQ2_9APHY|nr:uncharacterized protein FIBRA_04761 [Fibroporia radiculosa]CCM02657.1 predicted protein [Fibroporia radiculosa]